MVRVSNTILEYKKSLLTMGIFKSIAVLVAILFLEIFLALLCLPLYLTQDYLKNPILFNQNGFSYSLYSVRKHVTLSAIVSATLLFGAYMAMTWYVVRHAPPSQASTNTLSFANSAELIYDPAYIRVGSGVAALATSTGGTTSYADTSNATSSFGGGEFAGMEWDVASSSLQLISGSSTGMFTSRIIDAGVTSTWQSLSWLPGAPYGKEFPDNSQSETAYPAGNMSMQSLVALWHFNELAYASTTGEVVDSSGNGYHGAGRGIVSTTAAAIFNRAASFSVTPSSSVRVATSSFLSTSQSGTVMVWVRPGALNNNFRSIFGVGDEGGTGQRIVFGLHRDNQTATIFHQQSGGQMDYVGAASAVMPTSTWHHVAWVSTGTAYLIYVDGVAQTVSAQLGVGANSGDWFGDVTGADSLIIGARQNNAAVTDYVNAQIDELAVFDRVLSADEIRSAYQRGAASVQFQVRSCDDALCSGESFVGPTGASTSYYSELTTSTIGLPQKTLVGLTDARYFQYRLFVSTTDASLFATPELFRVTSTAYSTSSYPTSAPTVEHTLGVPFRTLDGFTAALGAGNAGTIKYQLALDTTSTWYYWNTNWVVADGGVAEANTAADINTHIATFDNDVGTGTVYVRAFLISDGSQAVELASVTLSTTSTVSFTTVTSTVNESVGTTTLMLALDTISSSTITVNYAATGGTAVSGTDYILVNGVATIDAGNTTTTISIPITNDQSVEGNETIVVTLDAPSGVLLGATSTHTITIQDNDVPGATVTESGGGTTVTESGTTDSYTIVLNTEPSSVVVVALATSTGDISLSTSSVRFTASNWNVPVTVTVSAVNDSIAEGSETATISHTASSTDGNYHGVSVSGVSVTITDNDTAGVTVTTSGGSTSVSESGTTDTYTIQLSSQPTSTVTIALATSTADVLLSTTTIQFTESTWSTPVTVTVSAANDAIAEGTESVTISHTVAANDAAYNAISADSVTVSVTDNDTAGTTITESSSTTEVNEAGATQDSYTIVLQSEPTSAVTVTLTTGTGGIYISTSSIRFTTGNWNVPVTVTVTAIDDATYEGLHASTISHSASSADSAYHGISIAQVTVDIFDNDTADPDPEPDNDATPTSTSSTSTSSRASAPPAPPSIFTLPQVVLPGPQVGGGMDNQGTAGRIVVTTGTQSRFVTLDVPGGVNVARMAVAYEPSFNTAPQQLYRPTITVDLCAGRERCRDGEYVLFLRVYTPDGVPSPTIERRYRLAAPTPSLPAVPSSDVSLRLIRSAGSSTLYIALANQKQRVASSAAATVLTGAGYAIQDVSDAELRAYRDTVPMSLSGARTIARTRAIVATMRERGNTMMRFDAPLRVGVRGEDVRQLQQLLQGMGLYPATVVTTGYYGSITANAVRSFQRLFGLPVSGVADDATRLLMNSILGL